MTEKFGLKKPTPTSLFCELARLKSQQVYLEKTQNSLKLNLSDVDMIEKSLLAEIEKSQLEIEEKFCEVHNETKYETSCLFDEITNFETSMLTEESLKIHNVITYREKVVDIDNQLSNVCKAGNIKLELLRANYKEIESCLPSTTSLLKDVPKYHAKYKVLQNLLTNPVSDHVCKEVRIFDKFLQNNGGNNGNWIEEEHYIYLKNKNKYKTNIDRIIECIQIVLPDLTAEEIKKHDIWYLKYNTLKTNKKIAIENWKNSKLNDSKLSK